jgi:hypothetical protein
MDYQLYLSGSDQSFHLCFGSEMTVLGKWVERQPSCLHLKTLFEDGKTKDTTALGAELVVALEEDGDALSSQMRAVVQKMIDDIDGGHSTETATITS